MNPAPPPIWLPAEAGGNAPLMGEVLGGTLKQLAEYKNI